MGGRHANEPSENIPKIGHKRAKNSSRIVVRVLHSFPYRIGIRTYPSHTNTHGDLPMVNWRNTRLPKLEGENEVTSVFEMVINHTYELGFEY